MMNFLCHGSAHCGLWLPASCRRTVTSRICYSGFRSKSKAQGCPEGFLGASGANHDPSSGLVKSNDGASEKVARDNSLGFDANMPTGVKYAQTAKKPRLVRQLPARCDRSGSCASPCKA